MVRSSIDRTWAIVGVGGSPRVTSSRIPGEEDQVGPCEQLDTLFLFNPLNTIKKAMNRPPSSPSRKNYEIAPKMPKVLRGYRPTI